jgi:CRP-like cAMP-binding protein
MDRELIYLCSQKNRILSCATRENIDRYLSDKALCVKEFRSGELVYNKDSENKLVGIILCGKVACEPYGAKDNTLLKLMSENDMFGIANLYSENELFPSVITAKTATKVLFINGDAFRSLIENDTAVLRAYLSLLSNKIIYLNKKIATLTAGTVENKLAAYILKNCTDDMRLPQISMSSLAEMLGVGRAYLYRSLDTLERDGAIKRDGKNILVTDKNALCRFTQG